MAEDAVEISEDLHEDAQKLMDANGKLDLEKVRKLELTPKQVAMVEKLEQKQRKMANFHREKQRIEEQATTRAKKKADAELDIDVYEDNGLGHQNVEKLQKLEDKLEKAEEDFAMQADNLFLSLGLKKAGLIGKISKKRAAMYNTNLNEEDDDFFDRTVVQKSGDSKKAPEAEADDIPSELMGLPTLDKVETRESLEAKLAKLQAEKAKLAGQMALEKAKLKQQAAQEEPEDSLDAFMNANVAEIRQDRGQKLERRSEAVNSRLAEFEAMLKLAKTNNEAAPHAAPKAAQATEAGAVCEAASRTTCQC